MRTNWKNFFTSLILCAFSSAAPIFSANELESNASLVQEQRYIELFRRGDILRQEGDFEKAYLTFKDCLALADKIGSKKYETAVDFKLAVISWNLGQLKEAELFYSQALALSIKLGPKESEKECKEFLEILDFYNRAREFRSRGEYDNSVEYFEKAIAIAKALNSPDHELKCLRQMSLCFWEQNDFNEFHSLNEQALSLAKQIRSQRDESICLNNIGLYYWKTDNYSKALRYYDQSLELAQKIKNVQAESETSNNIGIIYKEIGEYDKALNYLNRSLAIDKLYFGKDYVTIDLNNIGNTYRKRGLVSNNKADFYIAMDYFNRCLSLIKDISNKRNSIHIYNNLGTIYSDLQEYGSSIEYYLSGLKVAEAMGDKEGISLILNNIGIVHYNLGNYEESIRYCQKAIDLAQELKAGRVLWEAFLDVGNSHKKRAEFSEALKNYKNSVDVIESARATLDLEELKASYMGTDKRIEAYHELIDLLVRLHQAEPRKGYGAESLYYLEKAKSRAFLDSLEVAQVSISRGIDPKLSAEEKQLNKEITGLYRKLLAPDLTAEQKDAIDESIRKCEDDYEKLKREIRSTSPAYSHLKFPEIITLEEVQKKLVDDRTLFLTYSIGKDSSYGFAISRKGLKTFSISPRKTLQPKVTEYIKAISDRESRDFHLGPELFRELIEPGLDKDIKRLVFFPDDILYFLPFEALPTEPNGSPWLVERFSVSYAPSLSSMWEIIKRGAHNGDKPQKDLLAFADPLYESSETGKNLPASSDAFQNFYSSSAFRYFRLKYSGIEAQKIATLFRPEREEILLREKASERELKELNLEDFKIIHFAAHGLIDDQKPARSSIVLSLDGDPQEDGFVQTREIYNLRMRADLVSLSACQTGLGQFIRGEGIEGLNRAFFYAGASSVLMSLWAVNDQATSLLMERFYSHLRSSNSITDSLQKAKLELIHSGALNHPFYWAGFVVTGNTAKVIFPKKSINVISLTLSLFLGGILLVGLRNLKKKNGYRVSQD